MNTQPFSQTGQMIELCCEYLPVRCMWLYVIIMSRTRFRVNLHSIVCLNVKELLVRSRCHIWSLSKLSDNNIVTTWILSRWFYSIQTFPTNHHFCLPHVYMKHFVFHIISSNINEVIRAVLNFFFFFTKRFRTHQKHQKAPKSTKSTKKHQKNTKTQPSKSTKRK